MPSLKISSSQIGKICRLRWRWRITQITCWIHFHTIKNEGSYFGMGSAQIVHSMMSSIVSFDLSLSAGTAFFSNACLSLSSKFIFILLSSPSSFFQALTSTLDLFFSSSISSSNFSLDSESSEFSF